ncbi:VCBS repeat-containing protein [bacterium AH-315-P07]|nr:VCBS repeat-containing protein [bacterium AH-315-P07]
MFITGLLLQLLLVAEPIHQTLRVPADVWDVTAQDLNHDGIQDLIAFYGEQSDDVVKKGFYVFIARKNGSYSKDPSLDFPVDPKTGNAFFTRRDGDAQLVILTESGATQYRFQDNTFVESAQFEFKSLLPTRTRESIFLRKISYDLNDDDSEEWIIPVLGGFDVWDIAGKLTHLEADIQSEAFRYGGLNINHLIPTLHVFERPDTLNKAIGIVSKRRATFYYGDHWETSYHFDVPKKEVDQWDTQAAMADVNHDGYPDLMVTNTKGTANMEVLTHIYLADESLEFPDKPSLEMKSKGGLAMPFLVDLNNDEKLDMVVRGFPITLSNIANFLFRKKISMKIDTYTFKNGGYSKKPSFSNSITMDISEGREEAAYCYGDFDGDGSTDIALGARGTSLTILTHKSNGTIGNRAWKTIKVHTFGIARTKDLNDSGKDDIIIFHPHGKYQKEIDIIRF